MAWADLTLVLDDDTDDFALLRGAFSRVLHDRRTQAADVEQVTDDVLQAARDLLQGKLEEALGETLDGYSDPATFFDALQGEAAFTNRLRQALSYAAVHIVADGKKYTADPDDPFHDASMKALGLLGAVANSVARSARARVSSVRQEASYSVIRRLR
jgi:hypothetical protein